MNKINRIKELVDVLHRASIAYYRDDNPVMSDKQYDDLYDELEVLEKETGLRLAGSPTQKVQGEVVDYLPKVRHSKPMLSANKTKSLDDIKKFIGDKKVIQSWKMDGCFDSKTKILMADGSKKSIIDVDIGDEVLSFDEKTHSICKSKVTRKYYNGKKPWNDWLRITINKSNHFGNSYNLRCTKQHNILTKYGWKPASSLNVGDYVYYYDYIISNEQNDFILGSLLGDGWLVKRSKNKQDNHLEIHYSKTNKEPYCFLVPKLQALFSNMSPKISHHKSGYGSDILDINFHSIKVPNYIYNIDNQLRCGLTFTEEVCKHLNPLSLAILYIDDGSKCPSIEDGYINTYNRKTRCQIATNRHSINEVKIFSNWLNKNGYYNEIQFEKQVKTKNGGDGYRIQLTVEGTENFFDQICKYIPIELRKIKLGIKEKWQNADEYKWWEKTGEYGLSEGHITIIQDGFNTREKNKIRVNRKSYLRAYDLEVENTHTYFANGYAVHNCTVVAAYKKGKLVQAVTRGDGTVGEDVTHTFKQCVNIPLSLKWAVDVTFRGECVVSWDTFRRINNTLEQPYSHPRNLAAGSLRQLDANIAKERNLEYYVFDIVDGYDSGSLYTNYSFANTIGMPVVDHCIITDIDSCYKEFNPDNYRLPADGIIYRYDDTLYGESLGNTQHHPLDMMALKWADDLYETTLKGIEWQTSRTGLINPVAVFSPVDLSGAITTRATLHNLSYIEDLEMGVGDTIQIYRANMVVPKVHDNLTRSNTWAYPKACPTCGYPTEVHNENGSKTLHCTNPACKAKLINRLVNFVSRKCMNIDGLSEETLTKFVEWGWIKNLFDIYNLTPHYSELSKMSGFGARSVKKLQDAIENSKSVELDHFIAALSIPGIGSAQAKELAKKFKTWEAFEDAGCGNFDFSKLDSFGEVANKKIHNWFVTMYQEDRIPQLVRNLHFISNYTESDNSLVGVTFVITGSLNHFENRDKLKRELESRGAKVSGSVSAKTNFLISNDIDSTSSKNKKAKQLNIPIVDEEYIIGMLFK